MKNRIRLMSFLWLGCMLLSACIDGDDVEEGTIDLQAGNRIPVFTVQMNDGQTITNESLTGKPSLIVFFYTGCPDCKKELPVLQNIYENYAQKINMVCISREEGAADVEQYWKANGFTLPYSAQEDRTIYYLFAKSGIPRVYVTDSKLIIRRVFTDNPLASYEELSHAIEAAL